MTLLEDFQLLAMSPQSGGRALTPTIAEAALGSAVLIDLRSRGRVGFEHRRVNVVDKTPTGDPVLDDGLVRLQRIKPTRPLHTVRRIGKHSLGYVASNPGTDDIRRHVLIERIRPVVEHGTTVPEDLRALIGLMYVTNSFDHVVGKENGADGRKRGKDVLAETWSNQDEQYIIREAYASMTFTGLLRSAPRWLLSTTLRSAFKESLLRT